MAKSYLHLLESPDFRSSVQTISGGAVTFELDLDRSYRHNFAGIEYYSDINGTTVVTPGAGSETYTVKTVSQPNAYQPFTNNTVSASSPNQVNWAANTLSVRVAITGITGAATHCRMIATCNIS